MIPTKLLVEGRRLAVPSQSTVRRMPRSKAADPVDVRMTGFPPDPASQVTLANWQDPPNQRWAFQHMREIIASHRIPAGAARPLPASPASVGHVEVARLDGSTGTVNDVLHDTWTDALVVIHDGKLVEQRYASGMTARTPHLLMSVSKSIVGCVAGTLVGQGLLSPDRPVSAYVPEVAGSGYDEATVRHLLDMRTGVLFRETYTLPEAEVRVMERSMGWRPIQAGDPVGAYAYLTTLGHEGPHGDQFTYRSADTDLLGWVCERASGTRMSDLVSERIWVPIGAERDAEITCDAVGTAIHDGGISATARDLARFGLLLLEDGRVGQTQVVPESWLADSWHPDPDVREAFASSENEPVLPGGWYRNQFWFVPGSTGDVLLCLGIHGQMVHVDRATRTVAVKLSCWPEAQNGAYLIDTVRAFGAIGAHLAGTTAAPPVTAAAR
jgi:CubicO group peptidase (beta-lactamase class C family)